MLADRPAGLEHLCQILHVTIDSTRILLITVWRPSFPTRLRKPFGDIENTSCMSNKCYPCRGQKHAATAMPLQQASFQFFLEIGDPLGDCRRGKMFALGWALTANTQAIKLEWESG